MLPCDRFALGGSVRTLKLEQDIGDLLARRLDRSAKDTAVRLIFQVNDVAVLHRSVIVKIPHVRNPRPLIIIGQLHLLTKTSSLTAADRHLLNIIPVIRRDQSRVRLIRACLQGKYFRTPVFPGDPLFPLQRDICIQKRRVHL